jgi:hypothetical protein
MPDSSYTSSSSLGQNNGHLRYRYLFFFIILEFFLLLFFAGDFCILLHSPL